MGTKRQCFKNGLKDDSEQKQKRVCNLKPLHQNIKDKLNSLYKFQDQGMNIQ